MKALYGDQDMSVAEKATLGSMRLNYCTYGSSWFHALPMDSSSYRPIKKKVVSDARKILESARVSLALRFL